jgi:hypothetical protein
VRTFSAILLFSVALAGCGDGPEFVGDDRGEPGEATGTAGDERFGIDTRDGNVRLGITDDVVYFRLSDELLAKIDDEIEEDLPDEPGLGRTIATAVTSGISSALRHRMQYDIDDIRDVRYEDGALAFEFEDGRRELPDLEVDDEPLMEQFSEDDARRFVREFRSAKRQR